MVNIQIDSNIKSILIFGAKDHIGKEVARFVSERAPAIKLRLATHKEENLPILRDMYPNAETVVADLLNLPSLTAALQGIDGVFQVSPDVFNEDLLVNNMQEACYQVGGVEHIVRILGTPPGAALSLLPKELKKYRYYPAMQHLVARERYTDADLPVTFVNVAGYFMDDFIRMFAPPIFEEKTIRIAYDKNLAWIDPVDVAEVSAALLIAKRDKYFRTTIDVTGNDLCKISDVADLLTQVLGVDIKYDGDEQSFYQAIKPVFSQLWGERAPEYFMKYFKWETQHDHLFHLTPHVKDILGREPKTFVDWINDHRDVFLTHWK